MYEILCDDCGRVGIHPSGVGAETMAERHLKETGHESRIEPLSTA